MKYTKLIPGTLVQVHEGVGILVRHGTREVLDSLKGIIMEDVYLVLVNNEPKWYHTAEVTSID